MTLLQNYEDLIPLKRLDTLKIASLSIGEKSFAFQEKLNYYTKVDHLVFLRMLISNHKH